MKRGEGRDGKGAATPNILLYPSSTFLEICLVTYVLLVAPILTFLVSDVLTENGRLPMLTHLLGTHYLTIQGTFPFTFSITFADYCSASSALKVLKF